MAVVEAVLLIGFAIPLWAARVDAMPPESEALVVQVTGEQFAWNIHYPGPDGIFGRTDIKLIDLQSNPLGLDRSDPAAKDDVTTVNQLYLPVNKPVIVRLRSKDVIHSFGVPEFRVKQDAIPGLTIPIWFVPNVTTAEMRTRTGNPEFQYEIACAQLCGLGHCRMRGLVTVQTAEEFQKWMDEQVKEARSAPPSDPFQVTRLRVADAAQAAAAYRTNIFGVGIRARIRSSSFDGHAVEAALAAGLLDGPDDHAADERGDLLHARGGRIVPRDGRRRFGAVLDRGPVLRARERRLTGRAPDATKRRRATGERAGRVRAERIFGHQIAGHPVGPGAAAPAVAVHLALAASPAERGAAANAGEQPRGRPQVRETRRCEGSPRRPGGRGTG